MLHEEAAVGGLVQGLAGLGVGKSFVGGGGKLSSCGNGHCHCEDEAADLACGAGPSALPPSGFAHDFKDELAGNGDVPEVERVALGAPDEHGVVYEVYKSEEQMVDIMRLISKDLSEPYSIYTYRYFIHNWPHLCFLAFHDGQHVGAIVCKLDFHKNVKRGYIAMLAVDEKYRRKKIGSKLVRVAVDAMIAQECEEVVLETEVTNKAALRLYENLGFVRDKRLLKYYLNGVDAFRLKLWLR